MPAVSQRVADQPLRVDVLRSRDQAIEGAEEARRVPATNLGAEEERPGWPAGRVVELDQRS